MANPKPEKVLEGTSFVEIPKSNDGLGARLDATDKKLADIEQLTKYILWVGLIALFGVIVALMGIVIDQMRFNNSTYRDMRSHEVQVLQEQIDQLKSKK